MKAADITYSLLCNVGRFQPTVPTGFMVSVLLYKIVYKVLYALSCNEWKIFINYREFNVSFVIQWSIEYMTFDIELCTDQYSICDIQSNSMGD